MNVLLVIVRNNKTVEQASQMYDLQCVFSMLTILVVLHRNIFQASLTLN